MYGLSRPLEGLRILTTTQERTTAAEQVLHVRTTLGLTQYALAQALGVTERTIARWERGARVRRVYLDRLSDMLAARSGDAEQS